MRFIERIPTLGIEIIERRWIRDIKEGLYLLAKSKHHHSFSDWTWEYWPTDITEEDCKLDTQSYKSAPSSVWIKVLDVDDAPTGLLTCDLAATQDLLEGRIITEHYLTASVGGARWNGIVYGVTGTPSDPFYYTDAWGTQSTWIKNRLTWWNSYDLTNTAKLATRIDYLSGGDWVNGGITYKTRLTSGVNRCGVGLHSVANTIHYVNWDDTEIWG